jgi:opacity protein-like surface antigen
MGRVMRIRRAVLAVATAAVFVPALASAEGLEGRWSVALQGGTDLELSGDVHEGGSGTVLGLPTSVEARSFNDVYDPGFRAQLAVGYGVGPASEVFLRGSYYKMESETLRVGSVAGLDLNADFAEYKEWGAELGYRYYFRADKAFKPYVAAAAGLRFVSELPSTFSVPAAGVVLSDVPFYDSSTVVVFGADLGVSFDVSENVALGFETGPRYQTGLSDLEGLAGTGLEPINDTGSRWSMPFVATLSFRF